MNISRVTTISLVLAVAVFALAYANPSSAKGNKGKDCVDGDSRPKCDDDPAAAGLTFKVEMDGAFVMDPFTTSDGNELLGEVDFTIERPGLSIGDCTKIRNNGNVALADACDNWGKVFNVCGLYDIWGDDPYGPDHFTTAPGRNEEVGWEVYKFGGGVRVFFVTSILSEDISPEPLSVVMQLTSNCTYHSDHLGDFPGRILCEHPFLPVGTGNQTTFDMKHFWNHAKGKKGIAHAQTCHVGEGDLFPTSTLTITACTDEESPVCTTPPE